MKQTITLLLLSVVLFSCNPNPTGPQPLNGGNGTVTFNLNGAPYTWGVHSSNPGWSHSPVQSNLEFETVNLTVNDTSGTSNALVFQLLDSTDWVHSLIADNYTRDSTIQVSGFQQYARAQITGQFNSVVVGSISCVVRFTQISSGKASGTFEAYMKDMDALTNDSTIITNGTFTDVKYQ